MCVDITGCFNVTMPEPFLDVLQLPSGIIENAGSTVTNIMKSHIGQTIIPNCTEDQYALYCAAKDLYLGTKHMNIADLSDTKQITSKTFAAICNSMTVRRFGLGALQSMENEVTK